MQKHRLLLELGQYPMDLSPASTFSRKVTIGAILEQAN